MQQVYKSKRNIGKLLVLASVFAAIGLLLTAGIRHELNEYYTPTWMFHAAFMGTLATALVGNWLQSSATKAKSNQKQTA